MYTLLVRIFRQITIFSVEPRASHIFYIYTIQRAAQVFTLQKKKVSFKQISFCHKQMMPHIFPFNNILKIFRTMCVFSNTPKNTSAFAPIYINLFDHIEYCRMFYAFKLLFMNTNTIEETFYPPKFQSLFNFSAGTEPNL